MFTMRLDLSLCGMWYCEALVLLVGGFLFYTAEFLLYRGHTVLYALCMWLLVLSVVVYSALLYDVTACVLHPCWEKFIGSPKLEWVIVILSVGRGIGRGRVVGLFLWLLEFQQGIKYFVGGYVRIVILT